MRLHHHILQARGLELPTSKTVQIDAAGRAAAQQIANSTLIEYEGAPHGLSATGKERFTSELLEFLA